MVLASVRRAVMGVLTGFIRRWERRAYRNVALPPGFVLPSKRGMGSLDSDASASTAGSLQTHHPDGTYVSPKTNHTCSNSTSSSTTTTWQLLLTLVCVCRLLLLLPVASRFASWCQQTLQVATTRALLWSLHVMLCKASATVALDVLASPRGYQSTAQGHQVLSSVQ